MRDRKAAKAVIPTASPRFYHAPEQSEFFSCLQQGTGPGGQSGKRRKNDQKLEQLAFQIEPVFSALQRTGRLRVVVLEEFELYQQKVVEADHVIDLVD